MSEDKSLKKFLIVMALAVGLPSTIIGVFFVLYQLVQKHVISFNTLLIILLIVISYTLGLMVKNVLDQKNK